ncbi:unnamed protein product [Vitrella brassicaformis CCMP3155]|uniref:Methyltransferase domain-containing protein n=1 Tax=Vitrella brassicaformis (strain CCMP3155) TaxID=1169540 RepID=A0A0G4FCI8_VITBC|nr:unnamed protein product [Vitrella brassicaformis CCMP3155]|eukprot:CEM10938.1 unnamed protein product [Vitrella brassicaformis CCMP3155]
MGLLLFWCWTALLEPALLKRMQRGVWFVYLKPSAHLWDTLHAAADPQGGLWGYKANVHGEIDTFISARHPHYRSLWDTACNLGYLLTRLAHSHPNATHYGSDISPLMVNVTQKRCDGHCVTAPSDLFSLQQHDTRLPRAFPRAFDLVIVSDVLYYAKWRGLPPVLWQYGLLPSWLISASQHSFWDRLRSLACSEVILSNHENNPAVLGLMTAMGATPVMPKKTIWTAKGTAPREACNGSGEEERDAVVGSSSVSHMKGKPRGFALAPGR